MSSSWWFAALALLSVLFVLWPVLRSRRSQLLETNMSAERKAINDALYQEQLNDIQANLARGDIDQSQYDQLMLELDRLHESDVAGLGGSRSVDSTKKNLSSDKAQENHLAIIVTVVVALLLPLVAGGIYWWRGAEPDWEIQQLEDQISRYTAANGFDDEALAMAEDLRDKLEARLQTRPDNLNNWYLLANTAFELQDLKRSIEAYGKILEQRPNSPGVMANMVQVLYVGSGNQFTEQTRPLFDRAMAMDPQNPNLLGLGGLDAFQRENFRAAIQYWQRALQAMSPQNPRRATWIQAIAEAEAQLGDGESMMAEDGGEDATEGVAVTVNVSLADHVDAEPSDRVFVYARTWQGPPMPLSIEPLTVADLPAAIRLDRSKSMIQGMTMDSASQIELVARISSTGTQAAKSGEWEATKGPLSLSGRDNEVSLTIASRRP